MPAPASARPMTLIARLALLSLDSAREVFAASRDDRQGQGAAAGGMVATAAKTRFSSPICIWRRIRSRPRACIASGCTAIAYETVTDAHGGLPLLAPMSEVAGRLAIEAAGAALQRHAGGRGPAARRRAGRAAGTHRGDRRRRRRHACGAHGGRPRRRRHHSRPFDRPPARAGRTVRGPGAHAILDHRQHRGRSVRRRRRDRRGAGPGSERAETGDAGDAESDAKRAR